MSPKSHPDRVKTLVLRSVLPGPVFFPQSPFADRNDLSQWHIYLQKDVSQTAIAHCTVLRFGPLIGFSELRWFYQEGASHLFPEAW
jgi:hypothetical protein